MDMNSRDPLYNEPLALVIISTIFIGVATVFALWIALDIIWRKGWKTMMTIMIPVYVINALYLWPITLWTYLKYGRPPKPHHKAAIPQHTAHHPPHARAEEEFGETHLATKDEKKNELSGMGDSAARLQGMHPSHDMARQQHDTSNDQHHTKMHDMRDHLIDEHRAGNSTSGNDIGKHDPGSHVVEGHRMEGDNMDARNHIDHSMDGHGMSGHGIDSRHNMHDMENRPMFATVTIGVCHCGAGCVLGDIVGEWLVYGTGAAINGRSLWPAYLIDFAFALAFGIVFQYFSIAPMSGEYGPKTIWRAAKADVLSLAFFEIGLFGWMAIYQIAIWKWRLQTNTVTYWWMMQIGMFFGHWTAVPINYWLIGSGIKEPCA
ncbi:hypothetical protein AOQ84DRAFT_183488 [Glonium stellatum]|uniref:DUF4396 domain-containing protein n=1 Tax=Glonium stellatum TaxID=574774 RepID=A0A8E2F700_9PEZI|nr:hypothetical protein AOQ84DRAFT_183488 [Glonium stellatum]